MEGYLITLKKNRIKLRFENKNSISIKQIKEKLQEKYGYDKSYTKIMKNEEDNRELPNDSSVSNNFKLYLKNIKYIKFSYEQMKKSSSSNFRNYCIFENEEYHYSNSSRDNRKYNNNFNDYSILQKNNLGDDIKNYDLSLTHNNENDFYNYYDNNYENYNDNYGNNKSDKNIPSASNRDNLEFSLIKNNSDKDINTENKNNSNSNSNNNSNNNFIKGQYENDSNVIIGENDNNVTFPDSDIDYLMNIFNVSRERVIQALKEQKGNIEGAADSILNNAI